MIVKKYDDGYVDYSCDSCGKIVRIQYLSLVSRKRLDKQYCRSCSIKINNSVVKRKQTCLQKYGVDNPMRVQKFVDKSQKSCKENGIYRKQRNDFEKIKKSFSNVGYTLLTTEYKNRTQKLEFICDKGHKGSIAWSSWRLGCKCNECSKLNAGSTLRHTISFVKDALNKEGYELLSDSYTNKNTNIMYRCPEGHVGTVSFGNWISRGTRCSSCSHIESRAEIELRSFLQSYFPDLISNDRILIKPYELDIVISEKKVAIEYCGLYWHSDVGGKDKDYHLRKLELCKEKGYELVTVFEDEWLYKNDIVKSRILYKLGISEAKRVSARKCEIKEVSPTEKGKFLDANHIQGADRSSVQIGAFFDNKLISVMTFGKPNISRISKYEWELNRFCTDKDIICTGIASRLFKYFVTKYNPSTIITYGDKRWSKGSLYKVLGFNHIRDSKPNYWYFRRGNDIRQHRYGFRKSVLKDKLDRFDPVLTEKENMEDNGYYRIYDCGNVVWLYTKD